MKRRLVSVPTIELAVVEAREMLENLLIIKSRSGLDGSQRQMLQEIISTFEFSIDSQTDEKVNLPMEVVLAALRFSLDSQNFWMKYD